MNLSDAISRVRYRLGNRQNLDQTRIIDELADAQSDLEARDFLPWFLMQWEQPISTVANQNYVAKPSGYIREHEEQGGLWAYDSTNTQYVPLTKRPYADLIQRGFGSALPRFYCDQDPNFRLFSTPDAIYSLLCNGYFNDTAISSSMLSGSTLTNLWLTHAPLLIIAEASVKLAGQLQMPAAAIQVISSELAVEEEKLKVTTSIREEAWQDRNMGSRDAGNYNS